MYKTKERVALLLVVIMLFGHLTPVLANTENSESDLLKEFKFDADTGTIIKYIGNRTKVNIPQEINGVPVKKIEEYAFAHTKYRLREVELPEGLEAIEEGAFAWQALEKVTLPSTLKRIEFGAFTANRLKEIEIPEGVETLGPEAFDANRLTKVSIPSTVKKIWFNAFRQNRLESVEIPEGVEIIDFGAFRENQLEKVKFPSTLKIINGAVRYESNRYGDDYAYEQGAFSKNNLTSVEFPEGITHIGDLTFEDNKISELKIPNSVWNIGHAAFSNNEISSLDFLEGREKEIGIWDYAFVNNKFTKVHIPECVAYIGNYPFLNNKVLQGDLEIDNSAGNVKIERYAFEGMGTDGKTKLTPIFLKDIGKEPVEVPSDEFEFDAKTGTITNYNGKNKRIRIPKEIDGKLVKKIGRFAFIEKDLLEVDIPDTVVEIGDYAFTSNYYLYSVNIPKGVKHIGEYAFSRCNLSSIDIPDTVVEIGKHGFSSNNFSSINIPGNVKKIGDYAFYNNFVYLPHEVRKEYREEHNGVRLEDKSRNGRKINEVIISEGVEEIGNSAFKGNDLTSIDIPKSVTHIGKEAFSENKLTEVNILGSEKNETHIGEEAFRKNKLTTFYIPESVKSIGGRALADNYIKQGDLKIDNTKDKLDIATDAFIKNGEDRKTRITPIFLKDPEDKLSKKLFLEAIIPKEYIFAQSNPMEFKVTDEKGDPVPFARIAITIGKPADRNEMTLDEEIEKHKEAMEAHFENSFVGVTDEKGYLKIDTKDYERLRSIQYPGWNEDRSDRIFRAYYKAKKGRTMESDVGTDILLYRSDYWIKIIERNIDKLDYGFGESEKNYIKTGETFKVDWKANKKDPNMSKRYDVKYNEVIWTSSNPDVAEVDEKGVVTGKSEGKATISVHIKDEPRYSDETEVEVHDDVMTVNIRTENFSSEVATEWYKAPTFMVAKRFPYKEMSIEELLKSYLHINHTFDSEGRLYTNSRLIDEPMYSVLVNGKYIDKPKEYKIKDGDDVLISYNGAKQRLNIEVPNKDNITMGKDFKVKVTDESGKAVKGAKILYYSIPINTFGKPQKVEDTTDENGEATINIKTPSDYYICAEKDEPIDDKYIRTEKERITVNKRKVEIGELEVEYPETVNNDEDFEIEVKVDGKPFENGAVYWKPREFNEMNDVNKMVLMGITNPEGKLKTSIKGPEGMYDIVIFDKYNNEIYSGEIKVNNGKKLGTKQVAELDSKLVGANAIAMGDKIYVFGGYTGRESGRWEHRYDEEDVGTRILEYDVKTNKFKNAGELLDNQVVQPVVVGEYIYLIEKKYRYDGHAGKASRIYRYNPKDYSIEQVSNYSNYENGIRSVLWGAEGAVVRDDKIYFYVRNLHDGMLLEYNTTTNKYRIAGFLKPKWVNYEAAETDAGCLVEAGDKIYLISGAYMSDADSDIYCFDFENEWFKKVDKIQGKTRIAGARPMSINGKIYLFGGSTNDEQSRAFRGTNRILEFDPQANKIETVGYLPNISSGFAAAYLNNKVYTFGGIFSDGKSGTNIFNQVLEINGFDGEGNSEPRPEPKPEPNPEIDRTKLKEAINKGEKADIEGKTKESIEVLEEAIEKGKEVFEEGKSTQKQIDSVAKAIEKAIKDLKVEKNPVPEADRAKLKEFIIKAEKIDVEGKTAESIKVLEEVIEKGKKIFIKDNATQKEVDSAAKAIEDVVKKLKKEENPILEPKPELEKPEPKSEVDKIKLEKVISKGEKMDIEGKTKESIKVLKEAIEKGKEILQKEEVTQKEINSTTKAIEDAIKNLKLEPKPIEVEIPTNLKTEKKIKTETGEIKIFPDTFDKNVGKVKIIASEKDSAIEIRAVDEKEKPVETKKPIEVKVKFEGEVKNRDNVTAILVKEDGTKEPIGGVYDEKTKTIKFLTNEYGKFIVEEGKKEFKDTANIDWAKEAIESMAVKGIVKGKPGDKFDPNANISRAEFAVLASRMLKLNENVATKSPFKDISKGAWYYNGVVAVYENGIIKGKPGQIFDPTGEITREEMAKIIGAILKESGYKNKDMSKLNKFKDSNSISFWAKEGATLAVDNGIIKGNGKGEFAPKDKATRAEVATMLYRLYDLILR